VAAAAAGVRKSYTSVADTEHVLPILPNPALAPAPAADGTTLRPYKGLWNRFTDKYSLSGQQQRIHRGEVLFQAATRQATDP
jgi:hypothetical protein